MLKLTLGSTYGRYKVLFIFCQLLFLGVVCSYSQVPSNRSEIEKYVKEQSEKLEDLLKGYDKRFIPAVPDKPLVVKLQVVVSDVLYVDDNKMESEMILYIRQVWFDNRFIRNCSSTRRIKVREHLLDKIWLPDIRVSNLIDIKRFDGFGGVNMNIHENGRIYFSQLVLVKISCPMDLRNFPMDKQTCCLNFSSYAYAKNLLFFSLQERDKVIISAPLRLPQFEFVEAKEIEHAQSKSLVPKVTIALTFQRRSGYYILQIYLPSTFLVILSWLAFLMEASDIADRLALEVTMILSIVFLLGGINTSLPHVSYPKASDWFIIASFWFILMALLQTMLVYRMTSCSGTQFFSGPLAGLQKCWSAIFSRLKTEKPPKNYQVSANEESTLRRSSENAAVQGEADHGKKSWSEAFWLDKMSVIVFPVFYLMFNIIYWCHYLYN